MGKRCPIQIHKAANCRLVQLSLLTVLTYCVSAPCAVQSLPQEAAKTLLGTDSDGSLSIELYLVSGEIAPLKSCDIEIVLKNNSKVDGYALHHPTLSPHAIADDSYVAPFSGWLWAYHDIMLPPKPHAGRANREDFLLNARDKKSFLEEYFDNIECEHSDARKNVLFLPPDSVLVSHDTFTMSLHEHGFDVGVFNFKKWWPKDPDYIVQDGDDSLYKPWYGALYVAATTATQDKVKSKMTNAVHPTLTPPPASTAAPRTDCDKK